MVKAANYWPLAITCLYYWYNHCTKILTVAIQWLKISVLKCGVPWLKVYTNFPDVMHMLHYFVSVLLNSISTIVFSL